MHSHQEHYIHELSPQTILEILKNDAWKTNNQSLNSAITNDNDLQEPDAGLLAQNENTAGVNAFSDITFDPGVKKVLDLGGGKYDQNQQYVKREMNIDLSVWDPYNRSISHNAGVKAEIIKENVDAATSMSVLNVIPDTESRLAHITTLKASLKLHGKAYFKIWPGEHLLRGTYLPAATDSTYQANAFADRFLREIEIVFGTGNVAIHRDIPNLIVAVKKTEAHSSLDAIRHIQNQSAAELVLLRKLKDNSIQQLSSNNNILQLFSRNLMFFKKMDDEFVELHRHNDAHIQHEYDKRFGLVAYKR
jgi:hypothetical protein